MHKFCLRSLIFRQAKTRLKRPCLKHYWCAAKSEILTSFSWEPGLYQNPQKLKAPSCRFPGCSSSFIKKKPKTTTTQFCPLILQKKRFLLCRETAFLHKPGPCQVWGACGAALLQGTRLPRRTAGLRLFISLQTPLCRWQQPAQLRHHVVRKQTNQFSCITDINLNISSGRFTYKALQIDIAVIHRH